MNSRKLECGWTLVTWEDWIEGDEPAPHVEGKDGRYRIEIEGDDVCVDLTALLKAHDERNARNAARKGTP
jgi:hypothetical protein